MYMNVLINRMEIHRWSLLYDQDKKSVAQFLQKWVQICIKLTQYVSLFNIYGQKLELIKVLKVLNEGLTIWYMKFHIYRIK